MRTGACFSVGASWSTCLASAALTKRFCDGNSLATSSQTTTHTRPIAPVKMNDARQPYAVMIAVQIGSAISVPPRAPQS